MKKAKVDIPIYSGNVIIIVSGNFKKIEKKYSLNDTSDFDAFTFADNKDNYVIVLPKKCSTSILAHECLHIVGMIFNDHNIKMDVLNDEPQCYLLGWVIDECLKVLN